MKNQAVLQSCFSASWGGLEMVALETAQRLCANGFSVTTVCLPGSPLSLELRKSNLPVLEIPRRHKYFAWGTIKALRAALQGQTYGSVLVHQLNDLWQLVPALIGKPQIRLVGVAHTFVGIRKKDFLHAWLYRRLNSLVALTSLHKKNLTDHLPVSAGQVEILPNSVDSEKFHPSKRSEEFRKRYSTQGSLIGVVSRLDENKGLHETVAAAALLAKWGVDFRLAIVGKETAGEGGTREALTSEIKRLGLEDRVFLAGHHSDIQNVMASFDILLMPSPAETFGRVLIEAMASGVPIVATAGGGVPDIIQNEVNGLLVPPTDVEGMAKALRSYVNSADLRTKMLDQGLIEAKTIYETRVVEQRLYRLLGLVD